MIKELYFISLKYCFIITKFNYFFLSLLIIIFYYDSISIQIKRIKIINNF